MHVRLFPHALERLEVRCLLTATWGLEAIDAQKAWDQGYTGEDVLVAVIDSGVSIHADLWDNVWVNEDEIPGNRKDDDQNGYVDDVLGWDFADQDGHPIDFDRHGTQVAGTIAALNNNIGVTGVAFDAQVMPIRVLGDSGDASTNDIAAAIRYATDNGADIINLSIGGISTRRLELAVSYAASQDVLIVAASGNDGEAAPVYPARYSATMPNVISVGAHDESFRAVEMSNRVGRSEAVQVDAPGVNIKSTSTKNSYQSTSGTSIAAAHVAGIAALARSADPKISAAALRDVLVSASQRPVRGSDSIGAIDVGRVIGSLAVTRASAAEPSADFDANGSVGFGDFLVLTNYYGRNNTNAKTGDANGDGWTNFADFLKLFNTFGQEFKRPNTRADATDAVFGDQDAHDLGSPACTGLAAFLASSQSQC